MPGRGAAFAGGQVIELPLREAHGFLPALDDVPDDVWERAALVWLNSPNNPTGAVAPLAFLERLAALARKHGFVLASDEAYTELWFDAPPPSALQLDDLTNVVAFNTLSKRSSMTGFRSGFVAGDPALVEALRRFRPNVGTAPQEFVQRASVVAWGDEAHVERARESYRRKRELLLDVLRRKGLRDRGLPATMYLWIAVPDEETSEGHAARLLEQRHARHAGLVPRPVRRRVRPLRARADRGGVRPSRRRSWRMCCDASLRERIDDLWERGRARPGADRGGDRAARPRESFASPNRVAGGWVVNEWAKKAILLYFRLRKVEPMDVGGIQFLDKIPRQARRP